MKTLGVADRPPAVDKNDWRYFTIKTGAVKAFTRKDVDPDTGEATGTERYIIAGTASSSVIDLYGDILTEVCQASMLAQANGLTMWLNHSYNVPEDIAGVCINPQLKHATAEDGTACIDLEIELEVDPENPRAFKSWQHVNRGTQLAFSIGGFFTEYELVFEDENDWWGHFEVDNINLLEISLVGIPANPRAYTKTFENARAAVVASAEKIARDARDESLAQKRILVRKSFGLSAGEVEMETTMLEAKGVLIEKDGTNEDGSKTAVQCSHEPTCETFDAHEQKSVAPAEPVVAKSAIEDPDQQSKIVEAMKAVVNCVNSPGHTMCAEPQAHANVALSILKSALPDEYDLPEDAQLAAPSTVQPVVLAAGKTVDIQKKIDDLNTQIATLSADVDRITAEKTQLSADVETLNTEKTTLDQKIAELKATPTGRSTRSHSGGSSNESESTTTPEMYQRSKSEMSEAAARSVSDAAPDARSSAQVALPAV